MKLALSIATVALAAPAAFADITMTFDTPVTTGPTQAPGTWYQDRYAPAGFATSGGVLIQTIAASDNSAGRPLSQSGTFYNTQGRKYDLEAGTKSLEIDLLIGSDWGTTNRRMAGFWATGVDGANAVAAYPIISFSSDADGSGNDGFQVWDGLNYQNLGLPTGFAYGATQTLKMELVGGNMVYTIGNLTASYSAGSAVALSNVILQGHNTDAGVTYDIQWDNLQSVVPEPASLALLALGGGVALLRRSRTA